MKKITLDSTNHSGLFGEQTSYFSGYYLVDGKKFSDEGNTDRGDQALLCDVIPYIQEELNIDSDDEIEILDKILQIAPVDYEQHVVEISGTCYEDLIITKIK